MGNNQEDFERIADLNDDFSKSIIDSRLKYVQKAGDVSELDLPDVRADIDNDLKQKAARYNRK
jgi:hypothetical protein